MRARAVQLFTKLEPLFDQLSSFFNFGSPEEVIARLEDLESTRLDSFSRYTEAEAARVAAERALEQAQRDSASRVQELENALAAERRKGEREVASLRQQLDESHSRFAKTQNIEQQYLTLWNGVIDLFQRWADSELVGEGTPAAARPDVSNPTQLLETIALMFTLKAPSRAADSLRALTGFANVVWLKHFSSQPELKSRPREIYEKLEREVGALRAELARANSGLQQQATQLRAGEQSAADAERRVRALRYELDERQRLIASRFNRPQSAQVMNATAPAATATASSAIASAVASSGVGSAPSNTRAQSASTSRAGTVLDADADAEYFATIDEDDDDEHEGAGDAIAGSLVGASAALGVSSPAHRRSRSAGPVLAVRRDAHAKRQTVATAGSPVPLAFTGQPAGVALAERVRQHHLQQQHPHSAAAQIGRPMSAAALPARHQLTQQMLQLHSTQPALHARPPPPRRPGAAGGVYGSRA